jgi:DNA-binding MarR family transcriptional regulator
MENNSEVPTSLTDGVGFLLSRASGLLARVGNAALAPFGLRVRSYSVLMLACDSADGISQRDLAGILGLDPSQVVLLVDDLAAAGLVERRPSPTDRRAKLVAATDAGRDVRDQALAEVATAEARGLDSLSQGDRAVLHDLLLRLVADDIRGR